MIKQYKGITLIALVITIIVLLILAGVALASLSGENGLLKRANEAKKESEKESIREQIQLEVYGSYENDGNLELNILKENIEKNIPEAQVTGEEFPITVVEKGYIYQVDEDGNVEYLGQGVIPVVNKGSIKITNVDGSTAEKGTIEEGTALKIEFSASIEGGKITEVTPGNVDEDGIITYTTDGNEKEVIFTITGEVEGEEHQIKYKISVKEYYKKSEVTAEDIIKNPKEYYGKKVTNYKVNDADTNTYRIFYVDNENYFGDGKNTIYLKADYSSDTATACSTSYDVNTTKVKEMNPKWAKERGNEESKWNNNEKAAAWLCDTSKWTTYCNSDKANYAIGGPSVEMYVKSYNQAYKNEDGAYVLGTNYRETANPGYIYTLNGEQSKISKSDYITGNNSLDYKKYNSMYCGKNGTKTGYWWLASPSSASDSQSQHVCIVNGSDSYLNYNYYINAVISVSPLISLKSNSILKVEN